MKKQHRLNKRTLAILLGGLLVGLLSMEVSLALSKLHQILA